MIELYLHTKNYLDYFPGRMKYAKLGKSTCLTFWVPVPKVLEVIPYITSRTFGTYILLFCIDLSTKLCWGFWFNRIHLLLLQNMSLKIYTNLLFLFLWGCNWRRRSKCSFGVIAIARRELLLAQEVKMLWRSSKVLSWDIWV